MNERVENFCDWAECLLDHTDPSAEDVRTFGALSVIARAAEGAGLEHALQDLIIVGFTRVAAPAESFLRSHGEADAAGVLADTWARTEQRLEAGQDISETDTQDMDARWSEALPHARFVDLAEGLMKDADWPG